MVTDSQRMLGARDTHAICTGPSTPAGLCLGHVLLIGLARRVAPRVPRGVAPIIYQSTVFSHIFQAYEQYGVRHGFWRVRHWNLES